MERRDDTVATKSRSAGIQNDLVENHRGALPGNAVLPIIVGGVDRSAAEHASNSARGIGAVIGNATPHGGRANVTSMMVGNECLDAHKLQI